MAIARGGGFVNGDFEVRRSLGRRWWLYRSQNNPFREQVDIEGEGYREGEDERAQIPKACRKFCVRTIYLLTSINIFGVASFVPLYPDMNIRCG